MSRNFLLGRPKSVILHSNSTTAPTRMFSNRRIVGLHTWTKNWTLGCVNPASTLPLAAGGEFTQPRDHSFAQPCSGGLSISGKAQGSHGKDTSRHFCTGLLDAFSRATRDIRASLLEGSKKPAGLPHKSPVIC